MRKIHEINVWDDNTRKYKVCPRISDFPRYTLTNLVGKNKKLTNKENIQIKFDYPLDKPTVLDFHNVGGFTYWDFYCCVYEGYKKIYSEEDEPGYIPGMLNRETSEGPYGIWGHYMGDLFLEGFIQIKPGYFELEVGS